MGVCTCWQWPGHRLAMPDEPFGSLRLLPSRIYQHHRWCVVRWPAASCRHLLSGASEWAWRCPGSLMLLLARPDSTRSRVLASLPPSCLPIIALPAFSRETAPDLHDGGCSQRHMASRASVLGGLVFSGNDERDSTLW